MADNPSSDSLHERRVTWGLIGVVVLFVVIMSGIVLWVTSSLIRNELGPREGSDPLDPATTSLPASGRPTVMRYTPTGSLEAQGTREGAATLPASGMAEATWTPRVKYGRYVRYL